MMKKHYEILYHNKPYRAWDKSPQVQMTFPLFEETDDDARKKIEAFKSMRHDRPIKITGLREVTYRDVPLT